MLNFVILVTVTVTLLFLVNTSSQQINQNNGRKVLTTNTHVNDFDYINYINQVDKRDDIRNTTMFCLNLFKANFQSNKNSVFSPISFRILLSMFHQSSFGLTEYELRESLYLSDSMLRTLNAQKLNLKTLFKLKDNLKIINKIYLQDNFKLSENFKKIVFSYQSFLENINFNEKYQASTKVNNWISYETNGFINSLVTPDVFTRNMILFALNTIYFKARWMYPFNKETIFKSNFYGADGRTTEIDFMYDSDDYRYTRSKELKAEVLELKYEERSNSLFWIILPLRNSTIYQLMNSLNYNTYQRIANSLEETLIDAQIPKIQIETEIEGEDLLSRFGLRSIFERSELNCLDVGYPVKIDDVKQKIRISVDTDGTEVAAASYSKITLLSTRQKFVANRPFVFVILTADTKVPIFLGHYSIVDNKL